MGGTTIGRVTQRLQTDVNLRFASAHAAEPRSVRRQEREYRCEPCESQI